MHTCARKSRKKHFIFFFSFYKLLFIIIKRDKTDFKLMQTPSFGSKLCPALQYMGFPFHKIIQTAQSTVMFGQKYGITCPILLLWSLFKIFYYLFWYQSFGDVSPYVCSLHFVLLGFLSGHPLGNSCPVGKPFVIIVLCLFVVLDISHFGFKSGIWLLIASIPVHCFLVTFIDNSTM